jgi:hypothetical protein
VASRIVEERQPVFELAGGSSQSSAHGAPGRLYYGSSEGDRLSSASVPSGAALNIVDDTTEGAFGTRGANPFVRAAGGSPAQTPYINSRLRDGTLLLAGGAELYGTVSEAAADQAQGLVDSVAAGAPVGALAAIARRSSFAGMALEGFDALVFMNLTQFELDDPMLEFSLHQASAGPKRGGDPGASVPVPLNPISLLSGGWAEDEALGGDGANRLATLGARALFLTFVPSGLEGRYAIGANGLLASGGLAVDGAAGYLVSQPVPEPGSWALMGFGMCLVLMRLRQRSAARRSR